MPQKSAGIRKFVVRAVDNVMSEDSAGVKYISLILKW
jgi:hypothetical protein